MVGQRDQAPRPTNPELEYRISQVYSWILNGASRQQIVTQCNQMWGIKPRAVSNLIQRAHAQIGKVSKEERDNAFGLAVRRLNSLYMNAYAAGDIRACLAIQHEISDLFGLKKEQQLNVNTTVYLREDDLKML